ncbi:DUF6816 family protein [Leptolyngbya sp. CCY15150]|uniref:DUF6816 family protein n=1 Tax=Leptolyngbya sp. CCY15150 TaxID=2767772 RepID=UPI001950FB50|nr:hypothetical protein [Leptolyngbya sp. CCY15150]
MRRYPKPLGRMVLLLGLALLWLLCSGSAQASSISDRLDAFPNWSGKPPLAAPRGDLYYPDWFLGEWQVVTRLTAMAAPLAPQLVTPGYESNQAYLEQPISFRARFIQPDPVSIFQTLGRSRSSVNLPGQPPEVIADRAFNGLNLANAYLGEGVVQRVTVDASQPNRQITELGDNRQLISTITARDSEAVGSDRFLTTEVFQQEFRGSAQLYLNEVETTTGYRRLMPLDASQPMITADQVTAVYLSPQDPDYFKTQASLLGPSRPVALYRYRLEFFPLDRSG